MEDCCTPTIASPSMFAGCNNAVTMFPFPPVPDPQGLSVEVMIPRCYTPTVNDFKSPGLSPIFDLNNDLQWNTPMQSDGFKKPSHPLAVTRKTKNDAKMQPQHQGLQAQLQQGWQAQQPTQASPLANNASFIMNSTKPINKRMAAGNEDKSNDSRSFILNTTLEINTALRSIGLQIYASCFEEAGVDFQSFLAITRKDLHKVGISDNDHCNRILDLLRDLNRSFN